VRAYIASKIGSKDVLFAAIVLKDGDRHIGNIKLEPVNWRHRHAVLGILIGEAMYRGGGFGTEAMRLMATYAFDTMGLHRISLGVTSDNVSAIRCYEKVGLRIEGRLREAVRRDTAYVDQVWMGILDREFHET
jgi:RimJ/RimL family protein N-acetyltransferase